MMNVRKLQQKAAAGVDELLRISNDMDQYIIPLYKTAPKEIFDIQCRIMIGRCEALYKMLRQIQTDLADECSKSAAVTQQMIGQNLLLLEQKREILTGFLAHSDEIHVHVKASEQMEDMAEVTRLESTLRRELHQCRTEDRK